MNAPQPDTERPQGGLERHLQSLLTMGVAGLLGWQLITLEELRVNLQVDLARLSGRVDALAARVDEASSDRYRLADAKRDFALRDQRIQSLEMRIAQMMRGHITSKTKD